MPYKDKNKQSEYNHKYHQKYHERDNKRKREWYQKHKEEELRKLKEIYWGKDHDKILIYKRQYYQKNREKLLAKYATPEYLQYIKKRYQKIKYDYVQILGGKCQKCGYDKCIAVLSFHHKNPKEKEGNHETSTRKFKKKIESGEIELLCANCHIEFHNK